MASYIKTLEKLVKLFRPKTYNLIARAVIGSGLLLVLESQINIIQGVVIALYEEFIASPETLKLLLAQQPSTYLGFSLVVIGLVYHYFISTGDRSPADASLKTPPKLTFTILNADFDEYESNMINQRGKVCKLPLDEEIPDYPLSVGHHLEGFDALHKLAVSLNDKYPNREFYRERARLLRVWGGAELLRLKICNESSALATGVYVEIKIPRTQEVNSHNTTDDFPSLPCKEKSRFQPLETKINQDFYISDISKTKDDNSFIFHWDVGELQAKTDQVSHTCIFLRSEKDIEVQLTIYCHQIPHQIAKAYKYNKNNKILDVEISELISSDNEFNDLVNDCVMEGYIRRTGQKLLAEYERQNNELIP